MKVWDAGKRTLRLIQEVLKHSKAVTCLYIPPSRDKLYSGSLDKTIRVWVVKSEGIHCIQVHDVKESVHGLTAYANFAYFFSQGAGVKVFGWSGVTKHINFKQSVKCLDMIGDKLYCGCSGFSILVFSMTSKVLVGSLSSAFDIHSLAVTPVSNDFIFEATKIGTIEVWLKERLTKVVSMKLSPGITKITSLASDAEGEMLFADSSDGKIQAWELN